MARKAFYVTRGTSLGNGQFVTSGGSNTPLATHIAAVAALQAAVDDAQAAAEANATIAGDGTALGLVQAIGTAFAAYVAAVGTASTAASAKNAVLDIDDSVITTRAAAKAVLNEMMRVIDGSGMAD